jgi:hypothetical protein
MIVADDGVAHLVPLDDTVPRIAEEHVRAELTYITVG